MMVGTPDLISLFEELKVTITSSPVLARCDSLKPTFLKTDWSVEGMGLILIQPSDDIEFTKVTKALLNVVNTRLTSVEMVFDYVQFDLDREHAHILNESIIHS